MKNDLKKSNQPHWVSSDKVMKAVNSAHYTIVLGAWSNGKSYACKNGIVEYCYKHNTKFMLIRRNDLENRDNIIENYFLDCNVEQITEGKYNGIVCYRKDIYLATYDADADKWKKGQIIGKGFSVSAFTHTKSGVYQNFSHAIYEEFVTMGTYLPNEPYKLFRLVSSVARNDDIHVCLVGNTITPLCPYYNEWQLTNISKQKQGTIDTYTVHDNDTNTDTTIKVYMTEPTDKKSNMFFGHNKEIHGGSFHADTHDHVEGNINDANILYTVVFCYEGKKMLAQFVELDGAHFWYISPKTSEIQKNTRTIGDLRLQSDIHTKGVTPIAPEESRLFAFLDAGKIRYSDNLTGTIFLQMYGKLRRYDTRFS